MPFSSELSGILAIRQPFFSDPDRTNRRFDLLECRYLKVAEESALVFDISEVALHGRCHQA
jgi:hypothetical protein